MRQARPIERHVIELDALGWRVTKFQSEIDGDMPALWHVTITRVDLVATISMMAPHPEVALAELVRYAAADAKDAPGER